MSAENSERPSAEQIAASTIHQFISAGGVYSPLGRIVSSTDELLSDLAQRLGAPERMFKIRFQDPLDEVLIARGAYDPITMTDFEAKQFARKAFIITEKYGLMAPEGKILLMTSESIIKLWIDGSRAQRN